MTMFRRLHGVSILKIIKDISWLTKFRTILLPQTN